MKVEITKQGLLRIDAAPFEHDERFIPAMAYLTIVMTIAVMWMPVHWLIQKRWAGMLVDALLSAHIGW